jgi:hypothetical protein
LFALVHREIKQRSLRRFGAKLQPHALMIIPRETELLLSHGQRRDFRHLGSQVTDDVSICLFQHVKAPVTRCVISFILSPNF